MELFDTEPCILIIGENFDLSSEESKKITELPWACVFTSSNDQAFSNSFINSKRMVRDIFEVQQINKRALDKKNLKIVRLFNNGDLSGRAAQNGAYKFLSKIPEIIENFGKLFIIGIGENDKLCIEKLCDLFTELRNNSTIIFDTEEYLQKTELYDISIEKSFVLIKDYISNYIDIFEKDVDDFDYDEPDIDSLQLYIRKKTINVDKSDLFELAQFAILLNIEEVTGFQVPPYLVENYFYAFLKESAYEPQWYGFANGFNLVRRFETKLYDVVIKSLENPGNPKQKPICLVGQSGSGKSIAVANLAYKVFSEKRFPVIFMNNPYINFGTNIYKSNGDIKHVKSPQFEALVKAIESLESKSAESVLIIWDLSAATKKDRDNALNLYKKLKNRGRNIQLLFTSYDSFDQTEKRKLHETGDLQYPFIPIKATINLAPTEIEEGGVLSKFRTILKRKARMSKEDIDFIMSKIAENETINYNVMTMLYQTFYEVRKPMENGIQKEATLTIKGIINLAQNNQMHSFVKTAMQQAMEKVLNQEINEKLLSNKEKEYLERAIDYFTAKWGIDRRIYADCISNCITTSSPLPKWYLMLKDEEIIGSYGLITNDFISRQDLYPWLCALFVEENYRGKKLGAKLLEHSRVEAGKLGYEKIYLSTDHNGYYERCGWKYIANGFHPWGAESRIYVNDTIMKVESVAD